MSPEDYTKKFFADFATNSDKAIDNIYKLNPHTDGITDAINNMKKIANTYPSELGNYYGYELITQQKLTNNFVLLSYFIKYDRQPMRFTFEFYKPNDKWLLFSLNFDSNIDEEVEEAAKISNLKTSSASNTR